MVTDPHIKIVLYEQSSAKIFPRTDIKGGVVITLRDQSKELGPIGTFTIFEELNSALKKVKPFLKHGSLTQIIYGQNKFDLDVLNSKIPSANRTDKRLESNIFTVFDIFQSERQSNDDLKILGLINGKRVYRYVNREFIDLDHPNLNKYKVLLPVSNGSGALGEVISTPLIGQCH